MRPRVTMHMTSSIDGRIVFKTWPKAFGKEIGEIYEGIHRALKGDAWIVGRITMDEFGSGPTEPVVATERYPRTTWKAPGAEQGPYAVAVDASGRLHLNVNRANGDPIVLVLPEAVSDDQIAELRRDSISYLFAGKDEIELPRALEILGSDFDVTHLLLEGGGGINGSFLELGLIDQISLLLVPLADGTPGPTTFTRDSAPAVGLSLLGVERLDKDILHLRYDVVK